MALQHFDKEMAVTGQPVLRRAETDAELDAYVRVWNVITPDESADPVQQRERRERDPRRLHVLAELEGEGLRRIEAVPLKLDYCHTGLARGDDAAWVHRRFRDACSALGTEVREENERLVVEG